MKVKGLQRVNSLKYYELRKNHISKLYLRKNESATSISQSICRRYQYKNLLERRLSLRYYNFSFDVHTTNRLRLVKRLIKVWNSYPKIFETFESCTNSVPRRIDAFIKDKDCSNKFCVFHPDYMHLLTYIFFLNFQRICIKQPNYFSSFHLPHVTQDDNSILDQYVTQYLFIDTMKFSIWKMFVFV